MLCRIPLRVLTITFLALAMIAVSPIVRASGPGVHGRVLGHDESAQLKGVVAGAQIEFQTADGINSAQVTSDNNGYYRVDLPTGEYFYTIQAKGYRSEKAGRGFRLVQTQGYALFNLALTEGEDDPNRPPMELTPKKLGLLKGHVFEVTKGGRAGVSDFRLTLRREKTTELVTIQGRQGNNAQDAGAFEIKLEAGIYAASVSAPGFESHIEPTNVEIVADAETERDFLLKRTSPTSAKGQGIRGLVTVIDSDATPPSVTVVVVPLHDGLPPIEIQRGNNVAFSQDLTPGQYRVFAKADGFPDAESPPVFVLPGRYTQVNLTLRARRVPEPKMSIEVFVYETSAGRHVPLSDAAVTLSKSGQDKLHPKSSTTDKTGHAFFTVDEAGDYVAEAHLKGYRTGTGKGTIKINQTHEVSIELAREIAVPNESTLLVDVIDATSKRAISGVRLLARQSGQSLVEAVRGVTDAQGHAILKVNKAGEYAIVAQMAGYEPGASNIKADFAQPSRTVIALKPVIVPHPEPAEVETHNAIVNGYVAYREPDGQLRSIAAAQLLWKRTSNEPSALNKVANTSNAGRYQIELPPGLYEVHVRASLGFEPLVETVDVRPGKQDKYFVLRKKEREPTQSENIPIELAGQVVSELEARQYFGVPNAEVLFVHGASAAQATTDRQGHFNTRLMPAHYQVHVRAAGFEPLDTQIEVHQGSEPIRLELKTRAPENVGPGPSALSALTIVVVERRRGLVDALLPPLMGAQVEIKQGGRLVYAGQSNALGRYSARIKPGQYTVTASKIGYATAISEIVVAEREVIHQLPLLKNAEQRPDELHPWLLNVHVARPSVRPSAAIQLRGIPIPDAQVMVMSGFQQVAAGKTNTAGDYSVRLPSGNYAVKVMAPGLAPAGKTLILRDHDATLNFMLEGMQAGAIPNETVNPGARVQNDEPASLQPLGQMQTWYIVEHRLNVRAPWLALGEYPSQREAQAALFRAVEHGQIPSGAPAESRIRTIVKPLRRY